MKKPSHSEFSLVVPFLSDVEKLEATLASVLRYRPDDSQVIVVHDGRYPDPHQLDEVDFVVAPTGASLGSQLGCALRIAEGPLVGLIRPGVELDECWDDSIREAFEDDQVASVSPSLVEEARPNKLVVAGVEVGSGNKRRYLGAGMRLGRKARRLSPLGPSSWAGFYRRSVIDLLGTPDEQLDSHYLDVDLALGMRQLGFRSVFRSDCVMTVESHEEVAKELKIPHGTSAARAQHRFELARPSSAIHSLFELMSAPFQPWLVKHVMGKLAAASMRDIDEAFARRLKNKVQELRSAGNDAETIRMPHQEDRDYGRRAA